VGFQVICEPHLHVRLVVNLAAWALIRQHRQVYNVASNGPLNKPLFSLVWLAWQPWKIL